MHGVGENYRKKHISDTDGEYISIKFSSKTIRLTQKFIHGNSCYEEISLKAPKSAGDDCWKTKRRGKIWEIDWQARQLQVTAVNDIVWQRYSKLNLYCVVMYIAEIALLKQTAAFVYSYFGSSIARPMKVADAAGNRAAGVELLNQRTANCLY